MTTVQVGGGWGRGYVEDGLKTDTVVRKGNEGSKMAQKKPLSQK